jgi:hypothetical protein
MLLTVMKVDPIPRDGALTFAVFGLLVIHNALLLLVLPFLHVAYWIKGGVFTYT